MIRNQKITVLFASGEKFSRVYQFVSPREINRTVRWWKIAIGVMTPIIHGCTIANLFFN